MLGCFEMFFRVMCEVVGMICVFMNIKCKVRFLGNDFC